MNTENETAYVLHKRNYRESSHLVDLFSRDYGRLRAVSKGARGKRKLGGQQLQAFTPLSVSWRGKGELKSLTGVEASGSLAALQGESLYIGLYLNELLVRLLPEYVPHENLFDRYSDLIAQLGANTDPEPLLRRFELLLLEEIGYGFDLSSELAENRPIVSGETYYFRSDQGLIRVDAVTEQGEESSFEGEHLLAMAEDDFQSVEVRRCAKRLLRSALQAQLGERPLLSRQLFRQTRVPTGGSNGARGE